MFKVQLVIHGKLINTDFKTMVLRACIVLPIAAVLVSYKLVIHPETPRALPHVLFMSLMSLCSNSFFLHNVSIMMCLFNSISAHKYKFVIESSMKLVDQHQQKNFVSQVAPRLEA